MSATDDLLKNNEAYADDFDKGGLPGPPRQNRSRSWPAWTRA